MSSIVNVAKRRLSASATQATAAATKRTKPVGHPIVWIDCEMTGLDVYNDHIIEICCLITDGNLDLLDEKGYESTVYYPKSVLDSMNEWCVKQHGQSGLTQKILDHPDQTLEKVNSELLEYVKTYVPEPRTAVMAGNSIHMDKFFMMREFKPVVDHLHYRLIDVSSISEFGKRHNPELMKCTPRKRTLHTARSDIIESINQLKWYRENYLKSADETKEVVAQFEDEQKKERAEKEQAEKESNGEKQSAEKEASS
ncbi:hypothetical protein DIURU_001517 [Diutina rugosa]|uniref:Exonuclease domain-containing protein n=1 Tax=Diutina rugosa TaxID=5481 RepID=A0A642UY11_DIURU|nr:uncharacterized protein DIURU_001517 [Diutina rugosa]KAA8905089.1 hypothetical protein DIURU_001517 [Diutina rugosa]